MRKAPRVSKTDKRWWCKFISVLILLLIHIHEREREREREREILQKAFYRKWPKPS